VGTGSQIFRPGPFEIDSSRRILNRGAEVVGLPDRHMDVLLILASNAGNVVSKVALTRSRRLRHQRAQAARPLNI